jgi:SNF2 family DNA or RNA helicase
MKDNLPPLWGHQSKVVNYVNDNDIKYYSLLHDMGTGKTRTAIEILRNIYIKEDRVVKTLIIGPLATIQSWKREILAYSNIPEKMISVVNGIRPGRKTSTLPTKKEQLATKYGIYVINTDMVGSSNLWPIIQKLGIEILIVDEVHNFKSFDAKRTKELMKFSRTLKYKFTLTGSPVLQNAMDLWSQFYILNPDILGGNFYSFRSQYFYDANASMPSHIHFPDWKVKDEKYFTKMYNAGMSDEALSKQSLSNLNKTIYMHANRVMKKDVLDLPPITYQTLEVPLSPEQARIYEEMNDSLVANLDNSEDDLQEILEDMPEVMHADLAIVKTLRLMQIAAGVIKPDDKPAQMLEKVPRLKLLKDTLEEIFSNPDNKVIIWTTFKPTYAAIGAILEELGVKHTFITGEQSSQEKQDSMDALNNDYETRATVANQAAGGTGVTLNGANYSVYYSRSFNLGHDLQSEARNYRGGQVKNVTRIDLVAPNTIEVDIVNALASKKEQAEDILDTSKNQITKKELQAFLDKR